MKQLKQTHTHFCYPETNCCLIISLHTSPNSQTAFLLPDNKITESNIPLFSSSLHFSLYSSVTLSLSSVSVCVSPPLFGPAEYHFSDE